MEDIITIRFGKSKSKKFDQLLGLSKRMPNYREEQGIHSFTINDIKDFFINQEDINSAISTASKWKNSEILLFGKKYSSAADLNDFYKQLRERAGKFSVFISEQKSGDVSLGSITFENLPLPIVYYPSLYGAFFAFSDDIGHEFYFCECERKAIENYIKLRKQKPLTNYSGPKTYPLGGDAFPPVIAEKSRTWANDLENHIKYKEKICFRCNNVVPKMRYCLPMYGGQFAQHYGWLIKQEYYRLGIDKLQLHEANVLPEDCSPELYDNIRRLSELIKSREQSQTVYNELRKVREQLNHTIENSVREQLGFKKIGDAWVSETILYQIVQRLFPGEEIIRHHRPDWLEGLELDIYLPGRRLAYEYQGIQHFKPVEHWGGAEKLKVQQEHDARKKRICKELEVNLICINYDEELTEEHIRNRL